jgi:hypothetical protein
MKAPPCGWTTWSLSTGLRPKIRTFVAHKKVCAMPEIMNNPPISKRVFWDVNHQSLDYQKERLFIIDRVMNYGLWEDFVAVMRYYGKQVVRQEIVRSPYLKKDVLNFLCFYLDLKPSDFSCYTKRQSQEPHWAY